MNQDPYKYLDKLSSSELIHLYEYLPSGQLKTIVSIKLTFRQG